MSTVIGDMECFRFLRPFNFVQRSFLDCLELAEANAPRCNRNGGSKYDFALICLYSIIILIGFKISFNRSDLDYYMSEVSAGDITAP